MIFLGKYKHTLDDKNRLVLPSKFASILPKKIYVSKGFEGCLEIRTPEAFENFISVIDKFSELKKDSRNAARIIYANSHEIEIDSAKRILIPNELLKIAHINKSVVLIGVNKKIEIWDDVQFNKLDKQIVPMFEDIAERLDEQVK